MFSYTPMQWVFFFYFYCFFGWVFESTYVSLKSKKLVNRGFMRGPFLPLYGSGAIMMLVVSMPFRDDIILTYVAGCVGATALELVTGILMEYLFKVRYWDYTRKKFNYKGYICLGSTIAWGFLTIFMTTFLQRWVESICFAIPTGIVRVIVAVISVVLIADFSLSFKAALNIRSILVALERAKNETERIQKRLDVLIAVAADDRASRKQGSVYLEEMMDNLGERFGKFKERIKINPSEFMDDVKDEVAELRGKYVSQKEHGLDMRGIRNFFERDMIKGNPGMQSSRFADALEELKHIVSEKMNRTDGKKRENDQEDINEKIENGLDE